LSADNAGSILDLVPDAAIWRPITRLVIGIIRAVVAEGRDPDPVAVLASAKRRRTAADSAIDSLPTGPSRSGGGICHRQLALYLADAYTQVVDPRHVRAYACDVLAEAYRQAFRFHGIRMQQLSESNATRDDLAQYLFLMQDELTDLRRRAEAAAHSDKETA
jgi:hypothetical protein